MWREYKGKMANWWGKERWSLVLAMILGICLFGVWIAEYTKAYSQSIQNGIANEVVRFHVLANSDELFDQELKLLVRDGVLAEMGERLSACETKEESLALLENLQVEICQIAQEIVVAEGYAYPVSVSLVREQFPQKEYDDLVFPSGIYDAVRIEIGAAKGQNWWCVLYPQMCFVDATWGHMTEESAMKLENALTEEEYLVVSAMGDDDWVPQMKLKIVELWQNR